MNISNGYPLGNISRERFIQEYWQQKPLLIKNAFSTLPASLSGDELAGLSLEDDSRSRIVEQHSPINWQVKHGPFTENTFTSLSDVPWSLLVQNVDSMDEEVNALLQQFRFLPNWRLDDVMVSFATDQGGVGPHFDYYDVFLLQGKGKRRWRIGQHCDSQSALIPNQDMKILADFTCKEDWLVETGDLIYIPAQIAHWGESIGESMTYSIGFRSPSDSELLLECTQTLNAELSEDQRYRDGAEIVNSSDSGKISADTILRLQNTLKRLVEQPEVIGEWLGEYSTQLKEGIETEYLPLPYATAVTWKEGKQITLASFNRTAYIESESLGICFINGDKYRFSLETAKKISNYHAFSISEVSKEDSDLIEEILTHKQLFVDNDTSSN